MLDSTKAQDCTGEDGEEGPVISRKRNKAKGSNVKAAAGDIKDGLQSLAVAMTAQISGGGGSDGPTYVDAAEGDLRALKARAGMLEMLEVEKTKAPLMRDNALIAVLQKKTNNILVKLASA